MAGRHRGETREGAGERRGSDGDMAGRHDGETRGENNRETRMEARGERERAGRRKG